ncbi:hypothetical protein EPN52_04535 [bacterium]|nr:MAG: hypothetical protein EPN52_04535 [bacterium]
MKRELKAEFYFDDGEVLAGVYNPTLNVMRMILSPDPDVPVLWADMAREQARVLESTAFYEALEDALPACQHAREHVIAVLRQRGGLAWHGHACRICLLFFGPYYPGELASDALLDIKHTQRLNRLMQPH